MSIPQIIHRPLKAGQSIGYNQQDEMDTQPSSKGRKAGLRQMPAKTSAPLWTFAFCCLLCSKATGQAPIINSFSPASGPLGTSVTVNGSNFNATPAANVVYFGTVKATVTAASAGSLTVTVPTGATYQPVTVTTGNLTASSTQAFALTFPSNPAGITTNSFAAKVDFTLGNEPAKIAVGDFDGDGKIDLVTANQASNTVSVFRNTGTSGNLSFAAKADYATGAGSSDVAIADIDGDGKLDVIVSTICFSVFRNTSTAGAISFAPRVDFTGRTSTDNIAVGDIDGDGKPDVAAVGSGNSIISVFKNTSTGTAVSFNTPVDVFGQGYTDLAIHDLNGDGRPDLIFDDGFTTVSVMRNTTTAGTITFAARQNFATALYNSTIGIGDIDGDGKPDLSVTASNIGVSVLRNTSTAGTVSFATKVDFAAGTGSRGVNLGDLDGDGKPDLAVTNGSAAVSLLKNTSSGGVVSFAPKVDFATGQSPYGVAVADMDGDGKPDVSVTYFTYAGSPLSVIRSQADGPGIASFTPTNAAPGAGITINGTNLTGATSITIGELPATSFTVNSDVQITATVPAVTGGSVVVTTPNGTAALGGFYNGPAITSVSPLTGPLGTTVNIAGTNFSPTPANNTVYAGAVKAAVTSATPTSLTATIPTGITYQPFAVTTGSRTAYSSQAFSVTFPSNATGLTANSFAAKVDYSGANPLLADMDGDGKTDMILAGSIYRNTGSAGSFSFAAFISYSGTAVNSFALGDMDGDGKTDIVAANYSSGIVSVYKNTSTPGTVSFAAKVDIATVTNPASITVSDMDGDGKPDLAVPLSGYSIVALLRNTTSGGSISFASKTDLSVNSVTKVLLGDMDGDGRADMLVANYYANTVSVLKNTGSAGLFSFAAPLNYPVGGSPSEAAIGDLDGDGKPDFAVANNGSGNVSVARNTSTAGVISFAASSAYATGSGPGAVSIADVDGDGKPDLAVANTVSYSVSMLKNNSSLGSLAFAAKVDYANNANASNVNTGDLDGDGKPDLAVTSTNFGISLLRNQTAGTDLFSFAPPNAPVSTNVILNGINLTGATAVSLGGTAAGSFTVNSDAQITAIVGATAGGKVSVTTPKGTATINGFYNGPVITSFSPANGPAGTAVTISGSNFGAAPAANAVYFGAVKAIVSAASATSLSVTVPVGATFQPITVTANNHTASSAKPFVVTPPLFNGGISANSFTAKTDVNTGTNPYAVVMGDFDGDGKADIATADYNSASVSVFKNTSTGSGVVSFGSRQPFAGGYYLNSMAVADIDRDGKLDLIATTANSSSVSVYRNTTSGATISFATAVDYYTGVGSSPRSLAVADFDGDGKPDLAVGNNSQYLYFFRNGSSPGTVSFAEKIDYPGGGGSPAGMAAADMDGDGKPELIVTNYAFNLNALIVSVLKNGGSPGAIAFESRTDHIVNNNPQGVAIGDLDGDGKPDFAVANNGSGNVSVFRNTTAAGAISFAAKVDFATGAGPYQLALNDFDGDGKPDLVVANAGANTVSLLKNYSSSGTLSFGSKVDFTAGATPQGVAIGDLDGDAKPDLVVANAGASTFSVLRNQVGAPLITSFTPTNAAAGTTITINGSNFTAATAVSIGGIAASSFTVVNDGQITATVAAFAGGDVAVTTPVGTATLGGFYNGPIITSFSPPGGAIGTPVTINGNNFNATPAANTVYFGAVKAAVSTASATSLSVTVPVGATFYPPTVTTGNLTAYAAKPFTVTFPANTGLFTAASFAAKQDFATGTSPYSTAVSDFDGDGKADVAVANIGINSFSVLRNTGTSGSVSFAGKVDFNTGNSPGSVCTGDFDGDGKPDVAITNYTSNTVSVFKNLSTVGLIAFTAKVDYVTGTNPVKVKVSDINADGKPDLLVVNSINSGSVVSVFRNTSVGGTVSFAPKVDFLSERYIQGIAIGDFDGDGKPDAAINYSSDYKFSVLRNTSANGIISFAPKTDFTTSGTSYSFDAADLDGDGKDDIAIANYTTNVISFFRNTTSGGTVSFAPKVDVATGIFPTGIAIGDLNGDGKPDVAVANYNYGTNTLSVLKNGSTSGVLSFAAKTDYATGESPVSLSIADADGDGKPDLAAANYGSHTVSVFRNLLALPDPCAGGSLSYTANLAGSSYQWQVSTGAGFASIGDNGNYSGTNTATLQLSNLPSAWYGYQYRCVVDGANGNVFTLEFKNYWTGAVNNAWENAGNWSCGSVPDANVDAVVNSGTVMVSSPAVCRSLKAAPGAIVVVATGTTLSIMK